jgi:uncharacterized protein YaeQ
LATHTIISLYASSVASNVAWDTAQNVAHTVSTNPSIVITEQKHATSKLHGFKNVDVQVDTSNDVATVHITTDRPMFLPIAIAKSSHLARLDTTARARIENWR